MPSNAPAVYKYFVACVLDDVAHQRYPDNRNDYREFFLRHLQQTDPQMMEHLRYISERSGNTLYRADVDHVVPRSIWPLLLPPPLNIPNYECVLSNLKIRDEFSNRANDQATINEVKRLYKEGELSLSQKERWVEICLELKGYDVEGIPWTAVSLSGLTRLQKLDLHRVSMIDIHGNPVDIFGRKR